MFEHFAQLETLAQPIECNSWMLIGLELKLTLEFVVENNITHDAVQKTPPIRKSKHAKRAKNSVLLHPLP